jgi:hypothetical protein
VKEDIEQVKSRVSGDVKLCADKEAAMRFLRHRFPQATASQLNSTLRGNGLERLMAKIRGVFQKKSA